MRMLTFALRALGRDLRAGELRVLLWALVIGVAAFASVGLFTDRIRQAMQQQAAELLAADLAVESHRPLAADWWAEARRLGLRTSESREFRSVVLGNGRLQLTEVKAVAAGYPLRGELRIAQAPFDPGVVRPGPPPPGEVWAETRLLQQLGVGLGDRLQVGESHLRLTGIIALEPDRGINLFNIAPRLLMNLEDLDATGLIGVGARVQYRLLAAGEAAPVAALREQLSAGLQAGERLLGGREERPEIGAALDRAERFLGLASLVSLLVAAVAIAMSAHRHARRHWDMSAVLRCLGASRRFVAGVFLLQVLVLGLAGALLGGGLGYLAQFGLGELLGGLFAKELPSPSLIPLLQALLAGLITLAGFALPPLWALKDTPPLRVLRRDLQPNRLGRLAAYGPAGAALLALMAWQARDWKLTLLVFGGTLLTLGLLALVAWLLVRALRGLKGGRSAWRLGLASIPRRAEMSVIQMVAFGLGLMVLLLLSIVRGDLLQVWRETLPADAPNHFLINVQTDQLQPLRAFFQEHHRPAPEFQPMVRGRLRLINDREVSADSYAAPRAKRLVQREFNLTWGERMAADNQIVAGAWWDPQRPTTPGGEAPGEWSVEEGLAQELGIRLHDRLVFDVAGQAVAGRVTSLRRVQWDSFHPNFFVIAPPGLLDPSQASYITAFHLPADAPELPVRLVERFPNVTDIDVDSLMQRVRLIIERVMLSVEFVSLFTLLAGLIVLYAAIQASLDERLRESAILRTLGAVKRQIRTALAAEFLTLGLLAGLLATLAATLAGAVLARQLFELAYTGSPWLWLVGLLTGGLGLGAAGLWGARSVLREPPLNSLRKI
jgi:putative ABC transport system permease protein